MADGLPVILRELEGQQREVVLEGSALPRQGVEVGGRLRTVRTHYPGTRAASTQVLGTEEDPIELRGHLRDVWLGAEGAALAQMQALRDLYLGQRYCELSWGETLVRRGFIKEFRADFIREADIGYRLRFEVDEADEAEVLAPVEFEETTPEEVSAALVVLRTAADNLSNIASAVNVIQAVR